jgi:hypothetical protein
VAPLILSALLIGAAFGIRFKILVLVPAVGAVCAVILGVGLARGYSIFTIVIAIVAVTSSMQIGYLTGTLGVFGRRSLRRYANHPRGAPATLGRDRNREPMRPIY